MRSLLRASTAGLHAVVDARFAPMLDAGEAGYRSFLLASAAAVFPLEQALLTAGVGSLLPDWTRRTRAAALRADLTDLGITDVAAATAPLIPGASGILAARKGVP
jgi:heme oxygenase